MSVYICDGHGLEPDRRPAGADLELDAGVLARAETSGPVTRFVSASIVGLGPEHVVQPPYSDSGFQSVWITMVSGQTPLRLTLASVGAVVPEA